MRIAFMSLEYPPRIFGGLGVYVDEISRALASMDQKISVFTLGEDDLAYHEEMNGVDVFRMKAAPIQDGLEVFLSHETLSWGEGLDFLEQLLSLNQLSAAAVVEKGPFDLCVAHDWLALWGGMAVQREGLPLIYHVHGLESGRSDSPNRQIVALERKGAERADRVITVSEAMKREVEALGIPSEKVFVCYHGVDSDFFDPRRADPRTLAALRERYGFKEEDIIILFLGRLEPVKGVRELMAAMPQALSRHPRARLLMVGRGSLETWVREE
ncbi:MAG: glycosyltransferase family 4 protein, partial [Methanothrix sp.]